MSFLNLKVPIIEEGSCLLRNYALEIIRSADQEVVVFHYPSERLGLSEAGSVYPIMKKVNLLNGRVELYDENETPMRIKPEYFPLPEAAPTEDEYEVAKRMIIFDFVGCDMRDTTVFINAVIETLQRSNSKQGSSPVHDPQEPRSHTASAPDVLAAKNLDHHKPRGECPTPFDFITGISLRGNIEPNKFLTLFVSIPYLGIVKKTTISESQTLPQYRLRRPVKESIAYFPDQIIVHKAWLLVFDHDWPGIDNWLETIGIFRSGDDKNSNRAPLFPYQHRGCAFQALISIISNILTSSEQEAMDIFRECVSNLELDEGEDEDSSHPAIASRTLDLITMSQVVRSQITYLEDLRLIFQNSYSGFNPRTHGNQYPIPFIESRDVEMRSVIQSLTGIIAEREKFHQELGNQMKELDLLRTIFLNQSRVRLQSRTQAYLEQQGQIISVVNLMSIIFLPLGFLASYYAANFQNTHVTAKEFWIIAAPVTLSILVLSSNFLYGPDENIKLWIREKLAPRVIKSMPPV